VKRIDQIISALYWKVEMPVEFFLGLLPVNPVLGLWRGTKRIRKKLDRVNAYPYDHWNFKPVPPYPKMLKHEKRPSDPRPGE
jgi:hypothetical protein